MWSRARGTHQFFFQFFSSEIAQRSSRKRMVLSSCVRSPLAGLSWRGFESEGMSGGKGERREGMSGGKGERREGMSGGKGERREGMSGGKGEKREGIISF